MDQRPASQPVDLDQLSRQTGGDDALARDVLRLFVAGSRADFERLVVSSGRDRSAAAHLIVGSARAIGAGAVAAAASALEAGGEDVAELDAALDEAQRFIVWHLGQ